MRTDSSAADSPKPVPADSAREDGDSWDLTSSVGATATMVAAARAIATRETNPLIEDPFAEPLVEAVGIDFFTRLAKGEADLSAPEHRAAADLLVDVLAVRTRFYDDFLLAATSAGIQQVIILAAGLDSRAYRLAWPDGTVVYEIDQPRVIEFKTDLLADLGAHPTCERRTVGVDLRDDWPAALHASGFDPAQPTAWIAEGLLLYLPPDAQDRLFDNISAQSAPGSQLATEDYPNPREKMVRRLATWSGQWEALDRTVQLPGLVYPDGHNVVADYLERLDWQVQTMTRSESFAAYGRAFRGDETTLQTSLNISAIRK